MSPAWTLQLSLDDGFSPRSSVFQQTSPSAFSSCLEVAMLFQAPGHDAGNPCGRCVRALNWCWNHTGESIWDVNTEDVSDLKPQEQWCCKGVERFSFRQHEVISCMRVRIPLEQRFSANLSHRINKMIYKIIYKTLKCYEIFLYFFFSPLSICLSRNSWNHKIKHSSFTGLEISSLVIITVETVKGNVLDNLGYFESERLSAVVLSVTGKAIINSLESLCWSVIIN